MTCALIQPSRLLPLVKNPGLPPVVFIEDWNFRTIIDLLDVASGNTCTAAMPRVPSPSLGSSETKMVTDSPASGTLLARARKGSTKTVLATPVVASSTAPGPSANTFSATSSPFLPSTARAWAPARSTLASSSAVDM